MNPVTVAPGTGPIILSLPHSSDWLEPAVADCLNDRGLSCADTDWFVDKLYADLLPDATWVEAGFSRYVIDANRGPDDESLYPGQNTTGLCPTIDFTGEPIYRKGREPDAQEIERRRKRFHRSYHTAIEAQIKRLLANHRRVLLFDCHSIADELPFLFAGRLPAMNLGTFDGRSCDADLETIAGEAMNSSGFSHVSNGRFRGGWTTRHYGQPQRRVNAMQMELARSAYLSPGEPPRWDLSRAKRLRSVLQSLLNSLSDAL